MSFVEDRVLDEKRVLCPSAVGTAGAEASPPATQRSADTPCLTCRICRSMADTVVRLRAGWHKMRFLMAVQRLTRKMRKRRNKRIERKFLGREFFMDIESDDSIIYHGLCLQKVSFLL